MFENSDRIREIEAQLATIAEILERLSARIDELEPEERDMQPWPDDDRRVETLDQKMQAALAAENDRAKAREA